MNREEVLVRLRAFLGKNASVKIANDNGRKLFKVGVSQGNGKMLVKGKGYSWEEAVKDAKMNIIMEDEEFVLSHMKVNKEKKNKFSEDQKIMDDEEFYLAMIEDNGESKNIQNDSNYDEKLYRSLTEENNSHQNTFCHYCPECGSSVTDIDKFCRNCGLSLHVKLTENISNKQANIPYAKPVNRNFHNVANGVYPENEHLINAMRQVNIENQKARKKEMDKIWYFIALIIILLPLLGSC